MVTVENLKEGCWCNACGERIDTDFMEIVLEHDDHIPGVESRTCHIFSICEPCARELLEKLKKALEESE